VKHKTVLAVLASVLVLSCTIQAATWIEYRITMSPSEQTYPKIGGNTVVWSDSG